ncbi:MAG: hypothetical protein ACLTXL_09880 [Clostridia bacterium]
MNTLGFLLSYDGSNVYSVFPCRASIRGAVKENGWRFGVARSLFPGAQNGG